MAAERQAHERHIESLVAGLSQLSEHIAGRLDRLENKVDGLQGLRLFQPPDPAKGA